MCGTPNVVLWHSMNTDVHPGVTVEQVRGATGWPLRITGSVGVTPPPTETELAALRALNVNVGRGH